MKHDHNANDWGGEGGGRVIRHGAAHTHLTLKYKISRASISRIPRIIRVLTL